MREMKEHNQGRVFLTILLISVLFLLFAVPILAFDKTLFFGFMPAVWFWQILVLLVCTVVFYVYLNNYWPYRNL